MSCCRHASASRRIKKNNIEAKVGRDVVDMGLEGVFLALRLSFD